MLELASTIRDLTLSDSPIVFVPRPQDDPMVRQPDIALARDLLGWAPKVGLREGLISTIEWLRGGGAPAAAEPELVSQLR